MDFYAECEKRKQEHFGAIGNLAYRRQKGAVQIEQAQREVTELDVQIAAHEEAIKELERAQRNFSTYLAVKEGALTTDQLAEGIRAASEGSEAPAGGKEAG